MSVKIESYFVESMSHVLLIEGYEYTNNPLDLGGPTKFGITLNTLRYFRADESLGPNDVKILTSEEASNIYKQLYWDKIRLDEITDKLKAMVIFDQGVNGGTRTAIKMAQRAVNNSRLHKEIEVDGIIGPKTISAINTISEKSFCIELIKVAQLRYINIVVKNKSQLIFLRGWINRTHYLLDLLA